MWQRLLLVVATALALAGCGAGSAETELSDAELSASEFAAAADRTCREFDARFAAVQRRPARTPEAAERQAARLADIYRQAIGELEALDPPADVAGAYGRYLDARRRVIGYLEQARRAAARRDVDTYIAARERAVGELALRIRLAEAAGLRQCSRPHVSLGPDGPERGF